MPLPPARNDAERAQRDRLTVVITDDPAVAARARRAKTSAPLRNLTIATMCVILGSVCSIWVLDPDTLNDTHRRVLGRRDNVPVKQVFLLGWDR
jgi:hypothetical protein